MVTSLIFPSFRAKSPPFCPPLTLAHTATHCNTLPHTATQSHLSEFSRQVASSLPCPHTHSTTSTSSPTPLDGSSLKGRGGRGGQGGGGRSRGTLISAAESQGVCVGVGVFWCEMGVCVCVCDSMYESVYGVATLSRIDKIISLFCRILSVL